MADDDRLQSAHRRRMAEDRLRKEREKQLEYESRLEMLTEAEMEAGRETERQRLQEIEEYGEGFWDDMSLPEAGQIGMEDEGEKGQQVESSVEYAPLQPRVPQPILAVHDNLVNDTGQVDYRNMSSNESIAIDNDPDDIVPHAVLLARQSFSSPLRTRAPTSISRITHSRTVSVGRMLRKPSIFKRSRTTIAPPTSTAKKLNRIFRKISDVPAFLTPLPAAGVDQKRLHQKYRGEDEEHRGQQQQRDDPEIAPGLIPRGDSFTTPSPLSAPPPAQPVSRRGTTRFQEDAISPSLIVVEQAASIIILSVSPPTSSEFRHRGGRLSPLYAAGFQILTCSRKSDDDEGDGEETELDLPPRKVPSDPTKILSLPTSLGTGYGAETSSGGRLIHRRKPTVWGGRRVDTLGVA